MENTLFLAKYATYYLNRAYFVLLESVVQIITNCTRMNRNHLASKEIAVNRKSLELNNQAFFTVDNRFQSIKSVHLSFSKYKGKGSNNQRLTIDIC